MPADLWLLDDGFFERYDAWVELEQPPMEVRQNVLAWIQSRMDDPFEGARREPGFSDLWWATVPGSTHGDDQVVVCSFRVDVRGHTLVCDQLATLSWPV